MTKVLAISNKQLQLENVRFMFRPNFEGRKTEFNALGDRNFQIVIDPEDVPLLQEYGILQLKTQTSTQMLYNQRISSRSKYILSTALRLLHLSMTMVNWMSMKKYQLTTSHFLLRICLV